MQDIKNDVFLVMLNFIFCLASWVWKQAASRKPTEREPYHFSAIASPCTEILVQFLNSSLCSCIFPLSNAAKNLSFTNFGCVSTIFLRICSRNESNILFSEICLSIWLTVVEYASSQNSLSIQEIVQNSKLDTSILWHFIRFGLCLCPTRQI